MGMSVDMKRVYDVAEKINASLSAMDQRFNYTVRLIHDEGTILFFENAFLMRYYEPIHTNWGASTYPGEWILIFTEHHGFHVYPIDDLTSYRQYKHVPIEKHPDFPVDQWICEACDISFIEPIILDEQKVCPWCRLDTIRETTTEEKLALQNDD